MSTVKATASPVVATPPKRVLLGWIASVVIPLLLYWYLPAVLPESYSASANAQATLFLTLIAGAVCLWLFRLTPDFVPAILVMLMCLLLNLAPRETVLAGFTSDVFFLVLGMFLLAAMLTASGLTQRFALWVVLHLPDSRFTQPLILFITGGVLSTLIPSPLGRSAMLTPLALQFAKQSKDEHGQSTLLISNIQGSTLLSTVFLTGNPLNFVMLGLFDVQTQLKFQWVNWFISAALVAAVLSAAYVLWLAWVSRHDQRPPAEARALLQQQWQQLGPLSNLEKGALLALAALTLGILTASWHHVSLAWMTLFIAMALFLFSGLNSQDLRRYVDWPTLMFIAAIVAWGPMLQYLQLDGLIAGNLSWMGDLFLQQPMIGIAALAVVVLLIRLLFPGAPTFIILLSVLITVSDSTGISPWVLGFCLLTLSEAFVFPHQHGVYSQVQSEAQAESIAGANRFGTFVMANLWFTGARILALGLTLPYWSQLALI